MKIETIRDLCFFLGWVYQSVLMEKLLFWMLFFPLKTLKKFMRNLKKFIGIGMA